MVGGAPPFPPPPALVHCPASVPSSHFSSSRQRVSIVSVGKAREQMGEVFLRMTGQELKTELL